MLKILKRFRCEHKFMPYETYVDVGKDGHKYIKHTWKCTKCGKIK